MKILNIFVIPFLSGLFLALSFPKWNLWIFGFFALIPMIFSLNYTKNVKDVLLSSYIFGLTYFFVLLYWLIYTLTKYGKLPFIISFILLFLLSSYLAIYYILIFHLSFKLKILEKPNILKAFGFSLIWVSSEFLRSKLLTGFPWGQLGYILTNFPIFLQSADIWGIWGLSFIIAFINYYFYYLISFFFSKPKQSFSSFLINNFLFFLILSSICIYGIKAQNKWENILSKEKRSIKVVLLQGNIPQEEKKINETEYSFKVYHQLTILALKKSPDIILFPETSFPFFFPYDKDSMIKLLKFSKEIKNLSGENNPILIFGTFRTEYIKGKPKVYNTLVVWKGDKLIDFYDKEKLVPFGEYVPLEKYFSFLRKITVGLGILKSGVSKNLLVPLKTENIKITPLICFESAFSETSQKRAKENPQLVFIATNDAWFDKTSAPYQHFQMAIVRAVELRKYVIQVGNTGISGVIDPTGKILIKSELEKREILYQNVKPLYKLGFYVKYGNLINIFIYAYLVLITSLIFIKHV